MHSVAKLLLGAAVAAGIGAAGRGGYALGFNTLNPALRPEDHHPDLERDEHGRFRKRNG